MNWAQMGNMAGLGNAASSMLGLPKNQMNSRAGDWWDNAKGYAGYIPGPQQPFVQGFGAIGNFGENTIGLPEFFDPAGELISSFQRDPKTGKRDWGRIGANVLGGSIGSFLWNQMNQPEKRGGVAGMLLGGNRNNQNANNYFKYGTNMNQYGYGSTLPQKNMGGLLSMLNPAQRLSSGIQGAMNGQGLGGVANALIPGLGLTKNLLGIGSNMQQPQPQAQPQPQGQGQMGNLQAMGHGMGAGYPGPPPPGMYAMGGKMPQYGMGDVMGKVGEVAKNWATGDRDWGKIAGNTLTAAGLLGALGQGRNRRRQGGNRSNRMMDAMPPDSRMRMMNDMMGMMDMRYGNPRPGYGRFQAPSQSYAHWTPDMFNSQMGYMPTQYDYDDRSRKRGRGNGRGVANTLGVLGLLGGAGYGGYKLFDYLKNRDKEEMDKEERYNYERMEPLEILKIQDIYNNNEIPDIGLAKYGGKLSQHGYGKMPQYGMGDVMGKVGEVAKNWATGDRDWGKIAGNTLTAAGLLGALGQGRNRRRQGGNRSNRMMDAMPPDSRMRMMNDMMGMMDMRYGNPRPGYGRFQAPSQSYAHWTPDMFNSQMGYMPTQYDYDDRSRKRGRGNGRGVANTLGVLGLLGGAGYGGYKLFDYLKNRDKEEMDKEERYNYERMEPLEILKIQDIYNNNEIPDIGLAKYGGKLSQHGYGKMPQYGLGDILKGNMNALKNQVQSAGQNLSNQAQAAGSGIQNALQNTQQTFQNAGIPQGLQSGMQGMQSDMQQGMQNMGNKMQTGAQNAGNAMQRGMGNLGQNIQQGWQNLHDGTTATNFNTSMGQLGNAAQNVGNMAGNLAGTVGGLPIGATSAALGGTTQGFGNATGLDINPSGTGALPWLQQQMQNGQGQPGQEQPGQPGQPGANGQPGADGQAGGANWDNYWNSYWQNNPHSYAFQGANQSNPYGNYSPYGS